MSDPTFQYQERSELGVDYTAYRRMTQYYVEFP